MNKNKIIKSLEIICIYSSSSKKENLSQSFSWWNKEGISVYLSGKEYKEFNKIIERLFSSLEIKNNFQRKDLENALKTSISKILKCKGEKEKKKKILEEVNNLISYIKNSIINWVFFIPLENISIDKGSFNAGGMTLKKITEKEINDLHENHHKIILTLKNLTKEGKISLSENQRKIKEEGILNKICAIVKASGSFSTAKYIAMQKVNSILSILKLFTGNSETYSSRKYFGIEGDIIPVRNRFIYGFEENWKNVTPSYEKVGYLFRFDLSKERKKIMNANGFRKIINIYKKTECNDLDKRIFNTIYWFSKAYDVPILKKDKISGRDQLESNQFNLSDKYLKLMITLESILIFGKESKRINIKNRGSFILEKDPKRRGEIKKQLGYLYELRSEITHEGSTKLSLKDLNTLNSYVQSIILSLIINRSKWRLNSDKDLRIWFETCRLEEIKQS